MICGSGAYAWLISDQVTTDAPVAVGTVLNVAPNSYRITGAISINSNTSVLSALGGQYRVIGALGFTDPDAVTGVHAIVTVSGNYAISGRLINLTRSFGVIFKRKTRK